MTQTVHQEMVELMDRLAESVVATSIEFPFTEAPLSTPVRWEGPDCWAQAQHWLTMAPRPDLGYYKTDFVITYADGSEYKGRYDIGADAATLAQHIRDHLAHYGDPEGFLTGYRLSDVENVVAFQVGQTYECRSLGDYDCIWRFRVVKRTAQFITIRERDTGEQRRCKVRVWDGVEQVDPLGRYSLSPILSAAKEAA
jgi:hypothetical protein